jgi:hypothetical protein
MTNLIKFPGRLRPQPLSALYSGRSLKFRKKDEAVLRLTVKLK